MKTQAEARCHRHAAARDITTPRRHGPLRSPKQYALTY